MTDPFSIIAGVVGIATVAIRSSKALIELVDDIKGGPEEIKAVSRDVHAFYSIIIALNATLKDDSIRDVVSGDVAVMEMIRLLQDPLSNCKKILGELMVKIQAHLQPASDSKRRRTAFISVKWSLLTKTTVRDLLLRLEAT
ncbi:MAG: hypothetical protein Q9164_007892, partial [Protoblastenia rupestris]